MSASSGHNYIASLAADIRALHTGIRRNAEQIARDAIEAGKLLIEAKQSLPHGEWEAWLREHAAISPRTARRYMRVASSGLEIGHVADLGLTAAAKSVLIERAQVERIRRHGHAAWESIIEAGRHFGAVRDDVGEEQFRRWAPGKTGIDADEALFLAEIARVTDAGGDVAELLARDDSPKTLHLPAALLAAGGAA
jgi:hypothetical protein